MSRTERGRVGAGAEWWGKRPMRGTYQGLRNSWWYKRRLHKMERQQAKDALRQSDNSRSGSGVAPDVRLSGVPSSGVATPEITD